MQIIKSILDTDLYKLTQQQAVIHLFPDLYVRYKLIIRTQRNFPKGFAESLQGQIDRMANLQLTKDEKLFLLRKIKFLNLPYVDFLQGYRFNPDEVIIKEESNTINLTIEGFWYHTILWETPLMATISELFFLLNNLANKEEKPWPVKLRINKMKEKAQFFEENKIHYADFGARRRYCYDNHDALVKVCTKYSPTMFVGTSNPLLAMKYNTPAIGTIAHEFIMATAALYGYRQANRIAMDNWGHVYGGNLGIMLTDTFTSEAFFQDFDLRHALLFRGLRQDSGDPLGFTEKAIAHYKKLGIDPISKTIVFSDSLNPETAKKINDHCAGRIKASFGIGTNLTNEVGVKPLNIVIKLTEVMINNKWMPTIKLSDDPGKHLGPDQEIKLCKGILRI